MKELQLVCYRQVMLGTTVDVVDVSKTNKKRSDERWLHRLMLLLQCLWSY